MQKCRSRERSCEAHLAARSLSIKEVGRRCTPVGMKSTLSQMQLQKSQEPGADLVSKFGGGGDFSNIWLSSLATASLLQERDEVCFTKLL